MRSLEDIWPFFGIRLRGQPPQNRHGTKKWEDLSGKGGSRNAEGSLLGVHQGGLEYSKGPKALQGTRVLDQAVEGTCSE